MSGVTSAAPWRVAGRLRRTCKRGAALQPSQLCASHQQICVQSRRAFGAPSPSDLFTSPAGLLTLLYGRVTPPANGAGKVTGCGQSARRQCGSASETRDQRCFAGHWRVKSTHRNVMSSSPPFIGKGGRRRAVAVAHCSVGRCMTSVKEGSASSSPRHSSLLVSSYSQYVNREVVALIVVAFLLSAIWEAMRGRKAVLQQKIKDMFTTTLEVRSSREEFAMIMDWMGRQAEGLRLRNISLAPISVLDESGAHEAQRGLCGGYVHDSTFDPDERDATQACGRTTFVPGYGSHALKFGATWLWITRSEDTSKHRGAAPNRVDRENDVLTITFWSRRRQVVQGFLDAVRTSWRAHVENSVRVYLGDGYQWSLLTERACRPLTTLSLPAATKAVVGEVRSFLALRQTYAALGIPWRRGYLFEGAPGTGKTSFALALAGAAHLPVYVLNLHSDNMDDATLLYAISTLPPRVLLLIEDIESVLPRSVANTSMAPAHALVTQSSNDRSAASEGKVSMSALLNALDGVTSSEGRVLVITTNDASRIPNTSVLLRPGRVDRRVHFAALGSDECRAMQHAFATTLLVGNEVPVSAQQAVLTSVSQHASEGVVSPAVLQQSLLDKVYAAISSMSELEPKSHAVPAP